MHVLGVLVVELRLALLALGAWQQEEEREFVHWLLHWAHLQRLQS